MLRTQKYTIQTRKLTAPVTIAHLSDLHGFSQSRRPGLSCGPSAQKIPTSWR